MTAGEHGGAMFDHHRLTGHLRVYQQVLLVNQVQQQDLAPTAYPGDVMSGDERVDPGLRHVE